MEPVGEEISDPTSVEEILLTDLFIGKEISDLLALRDPPKYINPRFELVSVRIHVSNPEIKEGKLFGLISVSDRRGLVSDGWMPSNKPDFNGVSLFDTDWYDSVDISNNGFLSLPNPSSHYSVPFSSSIEFVIELFVTTKEDNGYFQLCNEHLNIDLSDFWDKKLESRCGCHYIEGKDGFARMYYILLRDAVDTTLEVTFSRDAGGLKVYGLIMAYYGGNFNYECHEEKRYHYREILFDPALGSFLETGKIQLIKSALPVPANGTLVIEAYLMDSVTQTVILDQTYEFTSISKGTGTSTCNLEGTGCSFEVKLDWKYQSYLPGSSSQGAEKEASDEREPVREWYRTMKGTLRRIYRFSSEAERERLLKAIKPFQSRDPTSHEGSQIERESASGETVCVSVHEFPTPRLVVDITPFLARPLRESDYATAKKIEEDLLGSVRSV